VLIIYQANTGGTKGGDAFRLRVGIARPNINKMSISPKNILSKIRAKFGMQDIQINSEYLGRKDPFDNDYIIQGDDEDKVRKILDQDTQNKIMSVEKLHMRIDFDSAYLEESLFNIDYARFRSLIDVTSDIVESMERLGAKDIPYGIPVSDDSSLT